MTAIDHSMIPAKAVTAIANTGIFGGAMGAISGARSARDGRAVWPRSARNRWHGQCYFCGSSQKLGVEALAAMGLTRVQA